MRTRWVGLAVLAALGLAPAAQAATFRTITNSSQAEIVVDRTYWTTTEQKAALMLQDEIAKRTGMTFLLVDHTEYASGAGVTAFLVGRIKNHALIDLLRPSLALAPEGFHLETLNSGGNPYVICAGADKRGTLYAVGKLLRSATMATGSLTVPVLNDEEAPQTPLRGHQLGYRTTNNTIDAWDVTQFEHYFRDLVVFGANAVELIPPRSPSDPSGPLMPQSPWQMTLLLCDLSKDYDLNVWMWIPAEVNLADSTQRAQLLSDRTALFAACNRVDAIFVPGGDPGSNPPSLLMPFVQDLATALRTYHPSAQVWVSHQGWEITDRDWFYNYLKTTNPNWLTGVVYGPWTRDTLAHTRAQVPLQYKLRHYPDIGHCLRSQYPQPHWDHAFALTLGREPINLRPQDETAIFQATAPYVAGAITYSDGVTDDFNKTLWSALMWNSSRDPASVAAEYAHYFIGDQFGSALAPNLTALEQNWRGAATSNTGIDTTLAAWQAMEAVASAAALGNWRFQEGLFRAYYDAYVRARRVEAAGLEQTAYNQLRQAPTVGANTAINNALATLASQDGSGVGAALRSRIVELGAALNSSIGLQLSVPLYGASGSERGAVLDFLDEPLNNRLWLENELNALLALSNETDKRAGITRLLAWEMGGPDGFYEDLGNGPEGKEPHLVFAKTYAQDPGFVESAQDEFDWQSYPEGRLSWRRQGQTLYDTPLQMQFSGLNTSANYTLRATYAGRFNPTMTLTANGVPIHAALGGTNPPTQYEFAIPQALTAGGSLNLIWQRVSGRGPQVAEVWLVRSNPQVIINGGAAYTTSTTFNLSLWSLRPREMQFQYPGSGGWTAWAPFSFTKQITVDLPTPTEGPVQVDFRMRYTDLTVSGVASATINMDLGLNPPTLTSGYVQPSSGVAGDKFTYRVKYWNPANRMADEIWVAIRSNAGGAVSWRPMWALDPSDTYCVDGKWYTYTAPLQAGNYSYRFAARAWATWAYSPQPTGTYQSGPTVAAGNPVAVTGGYVMPASGTNVTYFNWRVKYWNSTNAAPDEIKVAIWFPTLKTTYWYTLYPYDPTDTNYADGAVYQYSRRWLPPGAYAYRFAARQGTNWAYWPAPAGSYASGPTVSP